MSLRCFSIPSSSGLSSDLLLSRSFRSVTRVSIPFVQRSISLCNDFRSSSTDAMLFSASSISACSSCSSALLRRIASRSRSCSRMSSFLADFAISTFFFSTSSRSRVSAYFASTSSILLRISISSDSFASISAKTLSFRKRSSLIFSSHSESRLPDESTSMNNRSRSFLTSLISCSSSSIEFINLEISPRICSISFFISICSCSPLRMIVSFKSLKADSIPESSSSFLFKSDCNPISFSCLEAISFDIDCSSFNAFLSFARIVNAS